MAMCFSVKDQSEDLRELILYHQSIGVGQFYIFDDNSTVPASTYIQDLIDSGSAAMHLIVDITVVAQVPERWFRCSCMCTALA
jgi:hypothetical protein